MKETQSEQRVLVDNPLDEVLEGFYKPRAISAVARPVTPVRKPKPTHYKIVCISLEAMVAQLKRSGHSKANKSQLIRAALDQVDLSRIPKSY